MYARAYSFLARREDALDATQDVFMRVITHLGSLDPDRPLWPWLRRVTANVCANRLRARRSDLSLDEPEAERTGRPSPTPLPLPLRRPGFGGGWARPCGDTLALEAHLGVCRECRRELSQLKLTYWELEQAEAPPPDAGAELNRQADALLTAWARHTAGQDGRSPTWQDAAVSGRTVPLTLLPPVLGFLSDSHVRAWWRGRRIPK